MNNVILIGRLTRDPEIKYIGEANHIKAEFSIAIDRDYIGKDGNRGVDFIPIDVWGKKAEICAKYLTKGRLVSINGQIKVSKYKNANGETKSITNVTADNIKFLDSPKNKNVNSESQSDNKYFDGSNVFEQVGLSTELSEADLPF